jgi:hypothetical protein
VCVTYVRLIGLSDPISPWSGRVVQPASTPWLGHETPTVVREHRGSVWRSNLQPMAEGGSVYTRVKLTPVLSKKEKTRLQSCGRPGQAKGNPWWPSKASTVTTTRGFCGIVGGTIHGQISPWVFNPWAVGKERAVPHLRPPNTHNSSISLSTPH